LIHVDLFAGIGGFSRGLQQAGLPITKTYFSEIDKHAIAIYKQQHEGAEYVGSITDEHVRGIERPNIITFGSPCQDFSIAGQRKGMGGERSSLIAHAIELVAQFRPDFFIWENVKGTFSSNDGADFWAIIKAFADIGGYRLEYQLLNSAWFLPQNRERIYLVGTLGDRSRRAIFPLREGDKRINEGTRKTATVGCLTAGGNSGGMHSNMTLLQHSHGNLTETNPGAANCISSRDYKDATSNILCLGNGRENAGVNFGRVPSLTRNNGGHSYIATPVLTPDRHEKRQNGRRFKEPGDPAFTLTAQDKHGVMIQQKGSGQPVVAINTKQRGEPRFTEKCSALTSTDYKEPKCVGVESRIRRLTEIECERLQGFPDNWTQYGNSDGEVKKVSATQRYKCLGNAVTVDVVEAVGRAIMESENQ
jgi:DNA (cytosine-5)-methyltransferase 1